MVRFSMISLKNTVALSLKKLKVRKSRTLLSLLAASLLFGVIAMFMICTNTFLNDIFEFNKDFFGGKNYIMIEAASDDIIKEAKTFGAKIYDAPMLQNNENAAETNQENLVVKEFPQAVPVSQINLMDDEILAKFKIANSENDTAIPVFVSGQIASSLTGVSIAEPENLIEKSKNLVFESESSRAKVTYEIVGIFSGENDDKRMNKTDYYSLAKSFMYSRTDLGIIAPKSAQNKVNKYYSLNEDNFFSGRTILEFTDYNKMNEFSNENLCLNFLASNSNCSMDNLMVVNEFGSTPLRWENIKNNLNGIIVGVSIFFSLISIIILVGTFSKIFLDEQKTSAIFQAIGATRRDIFKIYATYAVILAIFVAIMVQIIGYFGAFLIQIWQSSQSTAELKIDFNLINSAVNLNFIGFTPQALWISVVAVISVLLSFLFVSRKISTKDIIKTLKE